MTKVNFFNKQKDLHNRLSKHGWTEEKMNSDIAYLTGNGLDGAINFALSMVNYDLDTDVLSALNKVADYYIPHRGHRGSELDVTFTVPTDNKTQNIFTTDGYKFIFTDYTSSQWTMEIESVK